MKYFKQMRKAASGFIGDIVNDAGGDSSVYLMNVVASIVPPQGFDPGYYAIMGLEFDQTTGGLYKLLLVNESEGEHRTRLLKDFMDACVRYDVQMVYASRGTQTKGSKTKFGFFHTLHNTCMQYRAKWQLLPAPSVEDVLYGMSLLREYIAEQAVTRPLDSIYRRKLTEFGVLDTTDTAKLKSSFDDPKLNVFHAVRYILAGIDRDVLPMAKPGRVYDLEAHRFYKPQAGMAQHQPNGESGFFI